MKEENKNFLYSALYQIFLFIIPLITTPYVSRVLGAANLGISSYTYSIVYYFMTITLLGINNYGSRNIAKVSTKNNKNELSKQFCSIYYLQLFLGITMFIIYNLMVQFVFKKYKIVFFIDNLYLLSAIIDINWFFFGMEKFKITISRNMLIKIFSFVLILLFVKNSDDLLIYILISSSGLLISQMYMWLHLFKYVKLVKVNLKEVFSNLKPCLILFIPVIAYSIYRIMDKTMLGSLSSVTDLGYYDNAEKIVNIPIGMIAALGTVMIPNMSKLTDRSKIKNKILDSFKLCFCFAIPMFFGIIAVSNDFSILFFGEAFKNSGPIMRYLAITILFSAIANVVRTNYLIPQKKDKIYVTSTILGALVNLIINILLIPRLSYIGACIGTIFAEFFVMFYQVIKTRNEIDFKLVFKIMFKYFIKAFFMFLCIIFIGLFINNLLYKIIVQLLIGVIIYFLLNYKYILFEFFNLKKKNT